MTFFGNALFFSSSDHFAYPDIQIHQTVEPYPLMAILSWTKTKSIFEFWIWVGALRPVGIWGHLQGENIQLYNLFSPVMMITWWMKLGGNRPPGDNPPLFSISGTGSFISPVVHEYIVVMHRTIWNTKLGTHITWCCATQRDATGQNLGRPRWGFLSHASHQSHKSHTLNTYS